MTDDPHSQNPEPGEAESRGSDPYSWLDQFRPASEPPPLATPPPRQAAPKGRARLTRPQLAILAGLSLAVVCLGAFCAGYVVLNLGGLAGDPAGQVAAGNQPTPTPVAVETSTPTITPVPPTATATPAPTPTATYAVAPEFINKDKIAEIKAFVERWRDLAPTEDVPIVFLTQNQVRLQWQENSIDLETLETVERQREFYLAMGLMDPDVDLAQAIVDSSTDNILGYYTPDEKVMYVIAESVNMFAQEEMTFAHEYTHALQDHHFDLSRVFAEGRSADALIAARAVPEGDARLVEELYTLQEIDRTQIEYNVYRYLMAEHPNIQGISPALGILTFFPYTAGEYFTIFLYIESGYNWQLVNQAYQRLPVSSEQVMHPEKYLTNEQPRAITLPDLGPALGQAWRELDRDVLGEIGLLVWLIDQVDELTAIDGAAGWGGDEYTLWIGGSDQRVLADRSTWDSPTDAVEFFEAFNEYMNLRVAGTEVTRQEEAAARIWEYETGVTLLARQGQDVLILVAPDRATLERVRPQFGGF